MPEGNRDDCVAIFKLDNLIVRVSRSYAQPYAAYLFNCPKLRPGAKLSSTAQARFSQVKSAAVLLLLLLSAAERQSSPIAPLTAPFTSLEMYLPLGKSRCRPRPLRPPFLPTMEIHVPLAKSSSQFCRSRPRRTKVGSQSCLCPRQ